MDCNSIIYDAVRCVDKEYPYDASNISIYEDKIIQLVIRKIREYIQIISPTNVVYIAFDGIAPLAKMDQQRNRRYKSAFMDNINFDTGKFYEPGTKPDKWSTNQITPGTTFMQTLSKRIEEDFVLRPLKGIQTTIVSTSNEPGEGEHKLFAHMREHHSPRNNTVVYGMDSDLIMLSLLHVYLFRNIFIFREAPEFSLKVKYEKNELLFMDVHKLFLSILNEMDCQYTDRRRGYEYVFICMILGNDFMDRLIGLNIRTNGIPRLMTAYREKIGKYVDRYLVNWEKHEIQWKWVALLMSELAKNEHECIVEEFLYRKEQSVKNSLKSDTAAEREDLFNRTPMIYRMDEEYMCPVEKGWEERYYRVKGYERSQSFTDELCQNYKEGLEWVYEYYTQGTRRNWQRKGMSPLIVEIADYLNSPNKWMHIRYRNDFQRPITMEQQLEYIMPPAEIKNVEYDMMFKRFLWECHIKIPKEVSNPCMNEHSGKMYSCHSQG